MNQEQGNIAIMEQEQENIYDTLTQLFYQSLSSLQLKTGEIYQLYNQHYNIIIQCVQILIIVFISSLIGNKYGKRGILIDKKIRYQFETIKDKKKNLQKKALARKNQLYYIQPILILLIIAYGFGSIIFLWQSALFFLIIGLFNLNLNPYVSTIIIFSPLILVLFIKYLLNQSLKRCEKQTDQDDQFMQQYCDSIINNLGPNLVKFMKNTLLKKENEELQHQKEMLIKQNQKPVEQVGVQNTITKVILQCSSDCKFEKKLVEKMMQKYQKFADNITSFAWCQVCQESVQQINQDNLDQIPEENQNNTICQAQCIQKYMQACKVIGYQYNKDNEEIGQIQNDYMMQKQIINQEGVLISPRQGQGSVTPSHSRTSSIRYERSLSQRVD